MTFPGLEDDEDRRRRMGCGGTRLLQLAREPTNPLLLSYLLHLLAHPNELSLSLSLSLSVCLFSRDRKGGGKREAEIGRGKRTGGGVNGGGGSDTANRVPKPNMRSICNARSITCSIFKHVLYAWGI
jgi:hypothetical protein